MRPPVLFSLNHRPSLPEATSSGGGMAGLSVTDQLRQENEQLRRENEKLQQENDALRGDTAKHEGELGKLLRIFAKELEEARSVATVAEQGEDIMREVRRVQQSSIAHG